jgi:hypothetical protein
MLHTFQILSVEGAHLILPAHTNNDLLRIQRTFSAVLPEAAPAFLAVA